MSDIYFQLKSLAHTLAAIAAATIMLAAAALPALAQTPPMGQQLPLTEEIVGNFVTAYPVVQERLDSYSDFAAPEGDSPADAMAAYLTYQQASSELDDLVGQYGFESFMNWVQTTSSVVTAYAFAREGGAMDEQLAQAIEGIRSNPNLTDEQKDAMIEQMGVAMQSVTALRPDQVSIDAVSAYSDELAEIFEDN